MISCHDDHMEPSDLRLQSAGEGSTFLNKKKPPGLADGSEFIGLRD